MSVWADQILCEWAYLAKRMLAEHPTHEGECGWEHPSHVFTLTTDMGPTAAVCPGVYNKEDQ